MANDFEKLVLAAQLAGAKPYNWRRMNETGEPGYVVWLERKQASILWNDDRQYFTLTSMYRHAVQCRDQRMAMTVLELRSLGDMRARNGV